LVTVCPFHLELEVRTVATNWSSSNLFHVTRTRQDYAARMTSSYVVAVECEGFLPLDPRDPENLDRKSLDRERRHNPNVDWKKERKAQHHQEGQRRKEYREEAEEQRRDLLAAVRNVAKNRDDVRLADSLIRDDGTAILYFEFDPAPEGDHFVEHHMVKLDQNFDAKRGPVTVARRVVTERPNRDTKGEGAKTWDSALRNEIDHARSTVVGAGLQVVECRVEALDDGKKKGAPTSKQKGSAAVSDPSKSTHQETQGSDEADLSDPEVREQRAKELREQEEAQRKEAERNERQSGKGKRSNP
jgi:hypothetical protein